MTDHPDSPEQALARQVLTIAVNGGINHWARVHGYAIDCPPELVRAEGIGIADRSLWGVGLDDISRAITKVIDQPYQCTAPHSGINYGLLTLATDVRLGVLDHRSFRPPPRPASATDHGSARRPSSPSSAHRSWNRSTCVRSLRRIERRQRYQTDRRSPVNRGD